jgi:spore germination cell wall hydrolase CwlJ-like protein
VLRVLALAGIMVGSSFLAGCAVFSPFGMLSPTECMTRVMYFESNRSSAEGMLAVGTVVMNRVGDRNYPNSVCGVVGQPNQFAPGVLWKKMSEGRSQALARQMAERVLRGERHPGVRDAKFFHTAGLNFPYKNMHYVLVAGGNAFYEKR